jgi:ABC-2 type transport system permease protein
VTSDPATVGVLAGPRAGDEFVAQRSPFLWLVEREVLRYLRIWRYAVVGPILSTLLFVLVFGGVLSHHVDGPGHVTYGQFIVPGLIAQAVLNVSYYNGTTSLFEARRDRYIHDVFSSPLRWWEINAALVSAAMIRAVVTVTAVLAFAVPLTGIGVQRPAYLVLATAGVMVAAAQFGVLCGALAQTFDHVYSVESLVLLPLGFLGGIFYSVHQLPEVWQWVSHINPLFWMVQAERIGFLGKADTSAALALALVWLLAVLLSSWSAAIFASGRLKD